MLIADCLDQCFQTEVSEAISSKNKSVCHIKTRKGILITA